MPDLPPFDPAVHNALLTPQVAPKGNDPVTHHLDSRGGRSVARCGTQAVRLSLNWALVNCQGCRNAAQQPVKPAEGHCPTGYRFKVGSVAYLVVGHREAGYGQVGCEVEDPSGVRCWMASEYIHEHGKRA